MKKIFLLLLSISYLGIIHSQELKQTVRGNLKDAQSKTPLIGAYVILLNSNPLNGTITDENGNFILKDVPVGRQNLKFSYVGYEELIIPDLLVVSGKESVIETELFESVSNLNEVKIVAKKHDAPLNSMAFISTRQFSVEETKRYAGGFGDPARMAGSFAGVASLDGESNEIIIRGNSPRGLLWRLEGIEIPNPSHFSNGEGSTGGGVSMINAGVMSNSDFYTGAFPAEYGNALSGAFDINLRKGNPVKREYAVQFGILGAEISLEGPVGKSGRNSYLLNYRNTIFTLLEKMNIKIGDNDITPKFQDLTFNVNVTSKNVGTFSLFGLGGMSSAGDRAIRDSALWIFRSDNYNENEYHKMGLIGLKHLLTLKNQKTYLKTTAVFSHDYNSMVADTLGKNYHPDKVSDYTFNYPAFRISSLINHKFNAGNTVRAGLIYSQLWFDMLAEETNSGNGRLEKLISGNGSTYELQGYMQWQHRIHSSLEINTGLHYSLFGLNGNQSVEPRAGVKWNIAPGKSLSYGVGICSRPEAISVYFTKVPSALGTGTTTNRNLGFSKALHHVIGYDRMITDNLRFKAEAYYQYLFNVPQPVDSLSCNSAVNFMSGTVDAELNNKGKAYNYGLEMTLEKFYSSGYYFLTSVSLYESKYKAPNGNLYNSVFNGNYIVNLVGGKEISLGPRTVLSVNSKLILRGGNRTTPINLEQSNLEGKTIYYQERFHDEKTRDFMRWDAGISIRKNLKHYSWELSADVQNLTNRKNIFTSFYDEEKKIVDYSYFPGLIPIVNFRIVF